MLVPIAVRALSGVRELIIGQSDESIGKINGKFAALFDQCLHRVRQVDALGRCIATECAECGTVSQEVTHGVGELGKGVDVLETEGGCRQVVVAVVDADQVNGCRIV